MAMKRGYCTNCNKNEETRRIFELNPDVKFCFCPHCGKKYKPRVAMANYKRVIQKYNLRATYLLKNAGEYVDAYHLFAYVLELESYNKYAKLGRLLSLAYLSTVRRNRFIEVNEMLNMEKEEFRGTKYKQEYTIFLLALNKCTVDYLTSVKNKLTLHSYFFDIDCAKLYYKHLRDAIILKRVIAAEFSNIDEESYATKVTNSIKDFEKEYNNTIITADGQDHYFANFAKSGEPLITNGRRKIKTKLDKYRLSTLNKEDKKLRIISDNVFNLKYRHMHRLVGKSIVLIVLLTIIAGGFLGGYFPLMKNSASLALLVFAIIFAVGALTLLTLRLLFISLLKKPHI